MIHALIECLSTGSADEETPTARRHREILARFEDLLQADLFLSTSEICAALGVAERTLRECCRKHLGMGPSRYRRLSRMQQVRRALRCIDPWAASAFEVAKRYGSSRSRPLCGQLSSPLRRISFNHFAAATWRGSAQFGPTACEISVTRGHSSTNGRGDVLSMQIN